MTQPLEVVCRASNELRLSWKSLSDAHTQVQEQPVMGGHREKIWRLERIKNVPHDLRDTRKILDHSDGNDAQQARWPKRSSESAYPH